MLGKSMSKDEMYNLAKQMGTADLLQTLKKQQSDYTMMNVSNNDFDEDKESEEKKKRRCCYSKKNRCKRYCTCLEKFYKKHSETENDNSFIS